MQRAPVWHYEVVSVAVCGCSAVCAAVSGCPVVHTAVCSCPAALREQAVMRQCAYFQINSKQMYTTYTFV
jgi:hypothetical protein